MRPTGDTGKFTIASQVRDGEVQVIMNALNKDDTFQNFLDVKAIAVDPKMKSVPLDMRQTAPGRYVGTFPADKAGSYFINVVPGPGAAPLTTGITVPYSEEFRVRESNLALLEALASAVPRDGNPGQITPALGIQPSEELINTNAFRGGLALARSIRDAWPWFVLAGCCLFLADVFIRRVSINFDWVGNALARLRGVDNEKDSVTTARLDALRRKKESIGDSLEKRRASVRFEPTSADISGDEAELSERPPTNSQQMSGVEKSVESEGPSYTERLLEAKRKAKRK
jgi:hypothetical protein